MKGKYKMVRKALFSQPEEEKKKAVGRQRLFSATQAAQPVAGQPVGVQTKPTVSTPQTRVSTLPDFLGGGQYTTVVGKPNELFVNPDARDIDSVKNEVRGGSFSDTLEEVNHIISVGLGGTKDKVNLVGSKSTPDVEGRLKQLFGVPLKIGDMAYDKRQGGRVKVENKAIDDYKSGKIDLPEARLRLKAFDFGADKINERVQQLEAVGKTVDKGVGLLGKFGKVLGEAPKVLKKPLEKLNPFSYELKKPKVEGMTFKVGEGLTSEQKEIASAMVRKEPSVQIGETSMIVPTLYGNVEVDDKDIAQAIELEKQGRKNPLEHVAQTKQLVNLSLGFIGPVGKVKQIDNLTKNEMVEAIDYIRLKQPYSQKMEESIGYLAEKFGITSKKVGNVANKFEQLVKNTKTKNVSSKVSALSNQEGYINPSAMAESISKKIEPLKTSLAPLKQQDKQTQDTFVRWISSRLVGSQTAEEMVAQTPKSTNGLQNILKYEAGENIPETTKIKQVFDSLYNEAKEKAGLEIPYRQNYLPQVYNNKPEEVTTAVKNYLLDKGVDGKVVDDYVAGRGLLPEDISNRLKLNPSFSKQRVFPNYETAMQYGLKPKYENIGQLVAHYKDELEKTFANQSLVNELVSQGKLSTFPDNVRTTGVNAPFSFQGYFAEPKLAKMVNDYFRDEAALGFGQKVAKGLGTASKTLQEIRLSAGVPKTDINFFAVGQVIRNLVAGDTSSIPAMLRGNIDSASLSYFRKNAPTIQKMANNGIDLGARITDKDYTTLWKGLMSNKSFKEKIGLTFGKTFNEKTFASFLPQTYIETFKQAEKRALTKLKMSAEDSAKFAANATRAFHGISTPLIRGKTTEDVLAATFFAPRFREGIIRSLGNTLRSVTTEIRNPAFYKNRRLALGMVLTYGMYDLANRQLTGHSITENKNNKFDELEIPLPDGNTAYLPFMPSYLAFARNMVQSGVGFATGDFETGKQKASTLLSMPLNYATQIWTNKDYFGNQIWSEDATLAQKAEQIGKYLGVQANHPYVTEVINIMTKEDYPLYFAISRMMELPLKFQTLSSRQKQEFYNAVEKKEEEIKPTKDRVKEIYDQVQTLVEDGKFDEAQQIVNGLPDNEWEIYKNVKASSKRSTTNQSKVDLYPLYQKVQELKQSGNLDEAKQIVNGLTNEEYRIYKLLKDQLQ